MAERVRAVKEGIYDPTRNSYAMDIWKQVRRKYDTTTSPILQEGYETTDYEPFWQEGKVAMWEDLMAKLPYMISDTSLEFEFGLFPPPVISNDTLSYLPEAQFTEKGPSPNPTCRHLSPSSRNPWRRRTQPLKRPASPLSST